MKHAREQRISWPSEMEWWPEIMENQAEGSICQALYCPNLLGAQIVPKSGRRDGVRLHQMEWSRKIKGWEDDEMGWVWSGVWGWVMGRRKECEGWREDQKVGGMQEELEEGMWGSEGDKRVEGRRFVPRDLYVEIYTDTNMNVHQCTH